MTILYTRVTIQKTLATIALSGLTWSCSNAGKSDFVSKPNAGVSDNQGSDVVKPSRIVITPKGQWVDLKGYVVGNTEHGSLTTLTDVSKPGFLNMFQGLYDIVLEGKVVGADGKTSPAALRISGVKIDNGLDTQIREVDLKPYINLEGKVLLNGESNHAGIIVGIPGTPLTAVTAGDGTYNIPNVPAGAHPLNFSLAGFNSGYINTKDYRADDQLPTIALTRDTVRLEGGVYYIGPSLPANSAQMVALQLAAPTSMTHFRFGTADDLSDRPWQVLQSSIETELPSGAEPEIYVQFSLDERQLSPIFSVKIPVDN